MQPGVEVPDLSVTHNQIIVDAIDRLSEKHRIVIEAIYFERVSYGILARRLGFSKPYVWRLTAKAREAIATIIATDPYILARYT